MNMRNAYLALGYLCNENCRCCPLIYKNSREKIIPLDRLLQEANQIISYGITDVTLSGGEPTLHPELFQLISHFHKNGIGVHLLSNGERFANHDFADAFLELSTNGILTVTTTFHSWQASEHEYQNSTPGSFTRSLKGIEYLDQNRLPVSVKHCITANNYYQLPEYIRFVLDSFSDNAEIQFWGIDLYGLESQFARDNFIDYQLIKPYIQKALDIFEGSGRSSKQTLTINNLPLCMCDCFYWRYFTRPNADSYIDHNNAGNILEANSGPASTHCRECLFRNMCMGAYLSNFEFLGDDIVSPPSDESLAARYEPKYTFYSEQNSARMVFSPYLTHRIGRNGYEIFGQLTNEQMHFRLKTSHILQLQELLTDGASVEELMDYFNYIGMNGEIVVQELMRKGIIE